MERTFKIKYYRDIKKIEVCNWIDSCLQCFSCLIISFLCCSNSSVISKSSCVCTVGTGPDLFPHVYISFSKYASYCVTLKVSEIYDWRSCEHCLGTNDFNLKFKRMCYILWNSCETSRKTVDQTIISSNDFSIIFHLLFILCTC